VVLLQRLIYYLAAKGELNLWCLLACQKKPTAHLSEGKPPALLSLSLVNVGIIVDQSAHVGHNLSYPPILYPCEFDSEPS
jgi:hypothetical protein